MNNVKRIAANPEKNGLCIYHPNILFSYVDGKELRLQLLLPANSEKKHPVLVFLQGSGWTYPNVFVKMPMFAEFAENGIAVAMITHRNRNEGYPAPAYLQDSKTAVRFLRANAERFGIDKERVMFGGTSSGGNTALLMGQTGDDPRYRTSEYSEESDAVYGIIDGCGPTDLLRFRDFSCEETARKDPFYRSFCGKNGSHEENLRLFGEMSPQRVFEEKRIMQPTLILHGTDDKVVPIEESDEMYRTLKEAGCPVSYYVIEGAGHDGSGMWSRELYRIMLDFILDLTNNG